MSPDVLFDVFITHALLVSIDSGQLNCWVKNCIWLVHVWCHAFWSYYESVSIHLCLLVVQLSLGFFLCVSGFCHGSSLDSQPVFCHPGIETNVLYCNYFTVFTLTIFCRTMSKFQLYCTVDLDVCTVVSQKTLFLDVYTLMSLNILLDMCTFVSGNILSSISLMRDCLNF